MYVSASELRQSTYEELQVRLAEFETVYLTLRQQAHSSTIERDNVRIAKKNVARCKSVMREIKLKNLVESYKGSDNLPKQLRPKLTKALRMKLTPAQENRKTKSQRIHAAKYPQQIFAFKN